MKKANLQSYEDLIKFINEHPGSPPSRVIAKYKLIDIDAKIESFQQAKEALYLMGKYGMYDLDKRKLIASILNTFIYNARVKEKQEPNDNI